jgi:nucleoside-diphosphate-sugar epimerase
MKILLTGDLGFIGGNLRPYLEKQDYEISGLDLKRGQDILVCDLPDCDIVIHLAAKTGVRASLSDAQGYWRTNVDGTRRILEHYKDKRILAASSSSQYEPYRNPYAASKYAAETIPHNNVCWMRFHTVYSDSAREGMLFDLLKKGTLEYVTDHERDFIHVSDVCRAIEILLDSDYVGAVDIGTGTTVKISKIRPDLPVVADTPYERTRTCADTNIMTSLGFRPKIFL